jgi:hypothetical protein
MPGKFTVIVAFGELVVLGAGVFVGVAVGVLVGVGVAVGTLVAVGVGGGVSADEPSQTYAMQ